MKKLLGDLSKKVFGGLKPTDGVPAAELNAAERRLEVRLPQALKNFYTIAGNHKIIARGFDVLLPAKDLYVKDNVLVFLREHQSVMFWGIKVSAMGDDPAVFQGNHSEHRWYKDADHLSVFLTGVVCWQVAQSLPYTAQGKADKEVVRKLEKTFKYADPGVADKTNDITGYYGDGIVVAVSRSAKKFLVGAKKRGMLEKFASRFEITLDFL